jgi:hypothetical protein
MERTTLRRAIKEQTDQTERTVEEGQTVEETKFAKEPDTAKEQTEVVKEVKEYIFFNSKLKHAAYETRDIYSPEIVARGAQGWEINRYVRRFPG